MSRPDISQLRKLRHAFEKADEEFNKLCADGTDDEAINAAGHVYFSTKYAYKNAAIQSAPLLLDEHYRLLCSLARAVGLLSDLAQKYNDADASQKAEVLLQDVR